MRMKDPDAGFAQPRDLDLDARYRARLEEIEEKESTVVGARPGATYLAYKFSLHSMDDNVPVLTDDGDVFLQWMTCNTNTSYSKVPYIGSREIAEALVGSKLDSDEIRSHLDEWDDWLVGRTALVDMQLFTDEKTGNERIRVTRIAPDRKSQSARTNGPATPSPEPAESRDEKLARLRAQMEALEAVE